MITFDSTKKNVLMALENEIKRIEATTQQDYEQIVAKYMHEEDPYSVALYSIFRIELDHLDSI
jgi:hypothetical protein